MKIGEAAKILAKDYAKASVTREQALSVHLFGIRYAEQIAGMSLKEIVVRAEIPRTYATELRKGVNLAKYVEIKR